MYLRIRYIHEIFKRRLSMSKPIVHCNCVRNLLNFSEPLQYQSYHTLKGIVYCKLSNTYLLLVTTMTITRITRNYFQSRTNELTHDFKRMIVIKNSNTDNIIRMVQNYTTFTLAAASINNRYVCIWIKSMLLMKITALQGANGYIIQWR